HQARAYFPLRQDRLLSTGETHVAGQCQLAADARRSPANARNRNDRSATQPHQHVWKLLQTRGTRRKSRRVLRLREEVVMCQEESIDSTVKHDNLDLLVSLKRRDDLVELGNRLRAEDVERRVIKRHTPVRGRSARQKNPFGGTVGHGADDKRIIRSFSCHCFLPSWFRWYLLQPPGAVGGRA